MKVNFLKKKTALADTKVTLARAFGLLLALALAFSLVALPALATPIPSHAFAGAVYVTNAPGQPAVPEGTVVTAEIGGVQYGDPLLGESYGTVNSEGNYGYPFWSFNVPGDDAGTVEKEGGVQLEDISFYVHGSKIWIVDVDFQSGFHSMVDLPVTDNIPPAVTIDELTPDPTNDSTPTFTGTATDTLCSITSVEYNVDGGAWTAADAVDGTFDSPNEDYTFTTAALADGTHMVCVRATDAATNTTAEIDYATDEFTIDNTPPTVAIDALTPDPTNDDTPTFTGTATDTFSNITSVEYKVNDGAWTAATASDGTFDSLSEGYTFTTAALTDGVHTVYTRAIDAVGNTTPEIDYASDEFTLDTIAPTVTIDALTPDPTDDTTPTFTGMATDAPSTNIVSVEYKVDGGAWAAAAASDGAFDSTSEGYTFTTPELAEGLHMVHTRATDAAGNTTAEIDYASDEFTVETGVDETPPQVVDTSPAADATDQAINVAVWAAFNEDVTTVDLSGITISGATGVSATLDEGTDTITINHDDFAQGQTYTVTIPAGAVQDMAANPNEEYSWSFTTVYPESVYTLALGEGWNVIECSTQIKGSALCHGNVDVRSVSPLH